SPCRSRARSRLAMPTEACVYVVDDDEPVRDSLSALFEANGYASRTFASAQEFIAAAPTLRPGCLIADIRMPGMDGLEMQQRLIAGLPNKSIAYDLGISARTVEIHRARVMDKMGTRSLSELVRLGLAAGLQPRSETDQRSRDWR